MNVRFVCDGQEHELLAVKVEVKRYNDGIYYFVMGEYRDDSYYYIWDPIKCFLYDADAALDYAEDLKKQIEAEKKGLFTDLTFQELLT